VLESGRGGIFFREGARGNLLGLPLAPSRRTSELFFGIGRSPIQRLKTPSNICIVGDFLLAGWSLYGHNPYRHELARSLARRVAAGQSGRVSRFVSPDVSFVVTRVPDPSETRDTASRAPCSPVSAGNPSLGMLCVSRCDKTNALRNSGERSHPVRRYPVRSLSHSIFRSPDLATHHSSAEGRRTSCPLTRLAADQRARCARAVAQPVSEAVSGKTKTLPT